MAVNVLILDPKKYPVQLGGQAYTTTTVKYVQDWCKTGNADLCFNLGMFNMSGPTKNQGIAYVHTPTGDLGYGGDSDILELPGGYACRGYSNGIVNGAISINAPIRPVNIKRTRNGIGITKSGKVIIAQSGTSLTEWAFCDAVNRFVIKQTETVKLFVLQDGGGSTSEYSAISKLNFRPEGARKVTTVAYVYILEKPKIDRVLRYNCKRGDDVKFLQMVLGGIEVDGSFGAGTRARVMEFQRAVRLVPDGICGPLTQKALGLR